MATVTRGFTFAATETVTNTKLHDLVDDATVTGIEQADLATGFGGVVTSTVTPTDFDVLFIDTNFSPPIAKIHDGSVFRPISLTLVRLTNKSGTSRSAGDVGIIDSANASSFTTTTTAANTAGKVIVIETIANDAVGLVAIAGGIQSTKTTGVVAIGDFLITSTTATRASAVASQQIGVFAVALTASGGGDSTVDTIIQSLEGGAAAAAFATPALTFGTANASGSSGTGIQTDDTILAFDDGNTPLVESGSGSVGSNTTVSHDDHVHPASGASGAVLNTDGAWILAGTVSLSDVGTGDVTGLDGNTDHMYRVIVKVKYSFVNVGTEGVTIQPNGSAANTRTYLYGSGDTNSGVDTLKTVSGFQLNLSHNGASMIVGDEVWAEIFISTRTNTDQFNRSQLFHGRSIIARNGGNPDFSQYTVAGLLDSSTNITSLRVTPIGAADRLTGKMWVYKPTAP